MQGAAVWTKSILAVLDPKLIEGMAIPEVDKGAPSNESPFVAGPVIDAQGDLAVMLGAPRGEPMLQIVVRRKGVTLTSDGVPLQNNIPPQLDRTAAGKPATSEASTTAAPLYPGRTRILGDSFYNSWRWLFAPFFSKLSAVYIWADPASITRNIIDSDTVVLEVVERDLASGVGLIAPGTLDEVERSLAAHHR